MLKDSKLDVVESFRYLGDELCPGSGCEPATIARTRAVWEKFRELLPLHLSPKTSLARHGMLFNSFVRGALLHAIECLSLRRKDIQRLLGNEWVILRWMCRIKSEEHISLL